MGARVGVAVAVTAIAELLAGRRAELDALNVFPVPDADTGTNVVATIEAARGALSEPGPDGQSLGTRVAEATVRAARGNSGVMLAQVLRALLDVPDGRDGDVLGDDLAVRLGRADDLARAAVARPVEGSLLSAVRAAASAAAGAATSGGQAQLRAARDAAHEDVRISPTRNAVLARAGVVDAGARAVALLLEALLAVATGDPPAPPAVDVPPDGPASVSCATGGGRYEVMFLLDTHGGVAGSRATLLADRVRVLLAGVGDSVVVVPGEQVVSAHVHTDDIGSALAAATAVGTPTDVRVQDLRAAVAGARETHDAPAAHMLVGAATPTLRALVTAHGGTVLPLDDEPWTATRLAAALGRATAGGAVVLLPGREDVRDAADAATAAVRGLGDEARSLAVVGSADGPATVVAALAVVDPTAPDARAMRSGLALVRSSAVDLADAGDPGAVGRLVGALLDEVDAATAELVTVLVGVALPDTALASIRDALAAFAAGSAVEVEVIEGGAPGTTLAVAAE